MEEKKPTKVSLSTVLLIIAFVVICVMGFAVYKFYDDKTKANNEVSDLKNQVSNLQNNINSINAKNNAAVDKTSVDNKSTENNTASNTANSSITDYDTFKNIVKNYQNEIEEIKKCGFVGDFTVQDIKKENNRYLLSIDFNKPIIITEAQHDEMLRTNKFVFKGNEYQYSAEDDLLALDGRKNYQLMKVKNGYVFVTLVSKGFVETEKTGNYLVYFDANTEISSFEPDVEITFENLMSNKGLTVIDYNKNNDSIYILETYY